MFAFISTEYFIVALICGIISSFFAKGKGKNPVIWFFIGFFLSFFAIFLVAFIRDKRKKVTK